MTDPREACSISAVLQLCNAISTRYIRARNTLLVPHVFRPQCLLSSIAL